MRNIANIALQYTNTLAAFERTQEALCYRFSHCAKVILNAVIMLSSFKHPEMATHHRPPCAQSQLLQETDILLAFKLFAGGSAALNVNLTT